MKILFLGGTGFISTAVSRLALARGFDLYHLNRGQRAAPLEGIHPLVADIHQPDQVRQALAGHTFDVVVDWIAYTPADVERDLALFAGRVKQFVFISSASAYQKPPTHPVTIVRPSHTYDTNFPIAIGGWDSYTLVDRLKTGRPIIVHGDGSSLWVVTHSDDFAQGFLGLLGNPQAIGHAFHITSDEVLTWDQIYAALAEAVGVTPNVVHIASHFIARLAPAKGAGLLGDKAWSVIFDNTKIKTFVPGFQARIPFRDGVRRTLAWFEADPNRCWIDHTVNAEMDRILAAYPV
jgi:nucleoside-diphosphate-sugar epimerase